MKHSQSTLEWCGLLSGMGEETSLIPQRHSCGLWLAITAALRDYPVMLRDYDDVKDAHKMIAPENSWSWDNSLFTQHTQ